MTLAAQPSATMIDMLADAVEAAWDDLVCGLYTNALDPDPSKVYADLVQPVYTGYLKVAMTIGARRGNANGDIIEPLGMASFQPTASPADDINVVGSFIANNATTPVLQLYEAFETPWVVHDTGSAIDVIWEVYIKADPDYGGICTTCVSRQRPRRSRTVLDRE